MKRTIIIICVIAICIVISITYAYSMYKNDINQVQKFNNQFSKYIDQEFFGTELATIINLAIDNNEKYDIAKDTSGKYVTDNLYSVRVDVYMTDTQKTYSMETLNAGSCGFTAFAQTSCSTTTRRTLILPLTPSAAGRCAIPSSSPSR